MITVTLPYDPVWTALEWAKKNCPSYITNDAVPYGAYGAREYDIIYFFGNEKDAIKFALRWT
jgi:hypothetical protein